MPKSPDNSSSLARFVALGLVCVIVFALKASVDAREKNSSAALFDQIKVLTDVISVVDKDYVREVDSKQLVEGAIKGLLATLDPHSGYLDPEFFNDFQVQTRGEFGGLGIEITMREGIITVVTPMEGSPAAKAGVKPGDSIVKIDGKFTKDFSLVDAVKLLRGPKGSKVLITLQRKGVDSPIDVELERQIIQVRSIKSRYLGEGFGYVRLSQFMEKTGEDLRKSIKNIESKNKLSALKGLILDLRNNPGGLLTQAISVSDLFLKEGIIVYTDGRIDNQKQKYFAHSRGTEADYPIIVLVNSGSASASEIVAGALKDHGRALIVGTRTFGKGSVQTVTPLRNGGAITLTTALYYTKSGRSIQLSGVTPDVVVESGETPGIASKLDGKESERSIREGDLPGAIENPSEKKKPKIKPDPNVMRQLNKLPETAEIEQPIDVETVELNTWLTKDKQFEKAVELLKTFNVLQVSK